MASKTMTELFADILRDAYSAETQLVKALPKMAKAATNPQLKAGFEQHLTETEGQVKRLDQIGQELNIKLTSNPCEAMQGLVEEGEEVIAAGYEPDALDAGLIASAQKVEHYEIATYGTLCTWAKRLGYANAQALLGQSLEEEKRTDQKLTQLAEGMVNAQATAGAK